MGEAVIDLGVLGDDDWAAAPPRRPRSWHGKQLRRAALALLCVAGVAALTGAAAPPQATRLWSVPSVTVFAVSNGIVYVHDTRELALTAYRLSDGTRLWQRKGMTHPSFGVLDGYVAVYLEGENGTADDPEWVEPETGRHLGTTDHTYNPQGALSDGTVLGVEYGSREIVLSKLWPTKGEEREIVRFPADTYWTHDRGTDQVTWWTADGQLHTRDMVSGAAVARDVGLQPVLTESVAFVSGPVEAAGDAWVLSRRGNGEFVVAAFDRTTLAPRWRRSFPDARPVPSDGYLSAAYGCGPVICVPAVIGGTDLIDPADGHTVRHEDQQVQQLGDSRWQAVDRDEGRIFTLLDVVTGEVPYPQWSLIGGPEQGRHLLWRTLRDATAFATFDESDGSFTRLPTVSGSYDYCWLSAPYLACREVAHDKAAGAQVTLWRVRGTR